MVPIIRIPHREIDKARWNALLEKASNGLLYAHSDMLDAMSPGWDALVAGDYEAVMPLTWRKKMGIPYLCQPAFCQQLGVFSEHTLTAEQANAFLMKAALLYRLIEVYLNYAHAAENAVRMHQNFVLGLNRPYAAIREKYSRDLGKNLGRAEKFALSYTHETDAAEAIYLYRQHYGSRLGYRCEDYQALTTLCSKWQSEGRVVTRGVYLQREEKQELLAMGVFLKDNRRLYNIASTTLPNGRMMEANHFLFDRLIREFAGTPLTLDFEGSDLPGVARFYQKFSPKNEPYFFWKSNRLPAVLRWWKR